MEITQQNYINPFLQGGGEMGQIIRAYNWGETSLGTPEKWPQALQISLSNILNSGFPMFLFWGQELTCFYNDAFRPSLGVDGKHPAIGKSGRQVWEEIWDFVGPLIEGVLSTGKPVQFQDQLIPFYRNGRMEDIYWTFSYSLLLNDNGQPGGVLVTCMETTDTVIARKQLKESESRFHSLFEKMDQGFSIIQMIFDDAGKPVDSLFLEMNSIFETQSGFKGAVGKRIREIVPDIEDKWFEVYGNVAKTGKSIRFTDGSEVLRKWFDIYAYPAGEFGSNQVAVLFTDITKQTLSHRRIQESEERFRSMIEQAPVAITLTRGPELIIEIINIPMVQFMAKASIEEVLGKKMLDVLPELEGQPALQTVINVQKTGIPFRGDEQPVDLIIDGEMKRHYFNFSYTPIMENGTTAAVLHVAIDVTQQVLSRKKIEESEGRFRLLADASPNLIWLLNPDGSYAYVNKTTLDFLDVTQEQIAEAGWESYQHPEDVEPALLAIKAAVQNRQPYHMEHRMRYHTGEYRWILSQALPSFDADGKVFAYVGSSIDIHEAKLAQQTLFESEQRFRKLADESPIFVFIIDADPLAPVSYWNKTWLEYTGQTADEAFGRAWNGILHGDDVPVVMKYYTTAFDAREPYFIPSVRVKRHDGVYRWHSFKGNPRYLPNGDFSGYVGVGFDIHEQKVLEERLEEIVAKRTEELQRINKELQRSNQNLEEFAHAASHDLKEPVRKIQFFTSQLKEQLNMHLQEKQSRAFTRIENSTERMASLIDDLLLYSHVSQRPHEHESVDLNKKIRRVLDDLELDIFEKQAVIQVGTLPVVKGYRRQIQQLFQNLISNAMKYSDPDVPPHIEITANEFHENGNHFHEIVVSDNGIGFEQEYADQIFKMFTRLHAKGEYSGTGVGLSIVKKVVENHNGFIKVESVVNKGSVFKVYLPC